MAIAKVDGLSLGYETIGEGRPWVITPGGRFTKESPGVRELAVALAAQGNRVLIWDRPNCGESDVCFEGPSESAMQADALAALLEHLDMVPAVIAGGSGGARVLAAHRLPPPEGRRGPGHLVDQRRRVRAAVVGHALLRGFTRRGLDRGHGGGGGAARMGGGPGAEPLQPAAVPGSGPRRVHRHDGALDAGLLPPRRRARARPPRRRRPALDIPALVFRSGASDVHHTRATSEALAGILPKARLVEPPWGDREWLERQGSREEGLFARWPLLGAGAARVAGRSAGLSRPARPGSRWRAPGSPGSPAH